MLACNIAIELIKRRALGPMLLLYRLTGYSNCTYIDHCQNPNHYDFMDY